MTVLTTVTDAFRPSALPFSVVIVALPAVENVTPEEAIMVPTMVPPPAALIVAALPTCQKTFLAWAPLIRMTLRGAPARSDCERGRHLEDPSSIGVPLGIEGEIRSRYQKRTRRSFIDARSEG